MHAAIEEGLKAAIESDSASTWVLSNHDVPRVATRYALPQIKRRATTRLRSTGSYATGRLMTRNVNSASARAGGPFARAGASGLGIRVSG